MASSRKKYVPFRYICGLSIVISSCQMVAIRVPSLCSLPQHGGYHRLSSPCR
ncbi:hypothetical protein LIPSTDRAFT_73443 [Lipomyces starkeyi NRRL Y-11557]|uniref:Uncharacterized protein n=1 Tax=Lipomyces starkeyi NRRL Y-11557 TaxID=675824 RepID=A0A1E3Q1Y5_LIPST|nr:hypothetical protein LIPSTDRAFT_73443 [Lipomyces starkeyi NRRL Y-11557]